MTEKQSKDGEFEILKQRYESLEKVLATAEKDKEYFQVRCSRIWFDLSTALSFLSLPLENVRTNEERVRTHRREVFESEEVDQRTARPVRAAAELKDENVPNVCFLSLFFREVEMREQQAQQHEKNELQHKKILELTKRVRLDDLPFASLPSQSFPF